MVGLSVVLEAQKGSASKKTPQVISKTTILGSMNKHSPSAVNVSQNSPFQESTFLHQCFLCGKRLLPGKDIYMYKWVLLQRSIKPTLTFSFFSDTFFTFSSNPDLVLVYLKYCMLLLRFSVLSVLTKAKIFSAFSLTH